MFRKLVKTEEVEFEGQRYTLRYFRQKTIRGAHRFSCELMLSADRIILDDDSMPSLESKVERLVPAMLYSRLLAGGRRSVAA